MSQESEVRGQRSAWLRGTSAASPGIKPTDQPADQQSVHTDLLRMSHPTAPNTQSERSTFDLCYILFQLPPRRPQLLPLPKHTTSDLLQSLIQLQVLAALLELQLQVPVWRRHGRIWGRHSPKNEGWLIRSEPIIESSNFFHRCSGGSGGPAVPCPVSSSTL